MKRFFLLLWVICVLYGLSWPRGLGESTEGTLTPVTLSHTTNCDSARVYFGYPSSNLYYDIKLFPLTADSSELVRDSLNLDSIGGHYVEARIYERDATTPIYTLALWEHKDPTPGDTIQRDASTFDPSTDTVAYVDSLIEPLTLTSVDSVRKVYLVDSLDQEVLASVDTESVARSTWNDDIVPQVDRTVTASCAGSGSDTFDIYVFDGDTTAVEGVDICIYNSNKTAKVVPSILTNVNGKAQVFLDAGTYPLYLQRLGVIYSQWDTITVSNGGIDTIWVTSYDPGSSPAGNLTTVKGFNRDFGFNKGERLTITFSLPYKNVIDTSQNVFIDRKEITVYSDTGYFETNLIPGIFLLSQVSGATKDSLKYNVKIGAPGRPVFEWNRFDVPDTTGAVWLIDLIR